MATLQIVKGADEGRQIPLDGDKFIMGRNPDCGIVIPVTSVSREHAQILRVQGSYFIEDKQSRNGTFVNNQAITTRTPLKNNDKIRICDFLAVFLDGDPGDNGDEEEETDNTTVEAMLSQSSHMLLEHAAGRAAARPAGDQRQPQQDAATATCCSPRSATACSTLFRQADRCFLILAEDDGKKLIPRLVKTRLAGEETTARFSKSIVRQCLETAQAFLSDDASRDERVQLSQSVVDFRIRSVMCVPLCAPDGKAFGVIQLDTQDRSKKFTQDDLHLLWGVANQASIALENARLHEETVHQEKLRARPGAGPSGADELPAAAPAAGARLRVLRPLRAGPGSRRRLLRLHPAGRRPARRGARRRGRQGRAGRPADGQAVVRHPLQPAHRAGPRPGRQQAQRPALRVHQPGRPLRHPGRRGARPADARRHPGQRRPLLAAALPARATAA